jgi:hypothetical protein
MRAAVRGKDLALALLTAVIFLACAPTTAVPSRNLSLRREDSTVQNSFINKESRFHSWHPQPLRSHVLGIVLPAK